MANLGTFIDGAYIGTYDAVGIGPTSNGWKLRMSVSGKTIEESDQYGAMLIDYFYRGGACRLSCDAMEYKAGTTAPFWPFGPLGQVYGTTVAGKRASDLAKAIVLTSTAGTPAAAAPASLTGTYGIIAPGQDLNLDFHTMLREVPLVFQLLPYTSSSNTIWFSLT